ncbi:MAG TPA: MFS transporter [Bacillota bacterium]|nr:MFS transporter [Bacillota bacterium]
MKHKTRELRQGLKGINNPFTALKHQNFRYYWFGMCVSLIGTWMQNIAQPWLAYSLTKSPLLLSLVGALQFTPVLLFSLFAGVIIDKYPKKQILLFTQSASLIITFTLATLIWLGKVRYWHILVSATALGMVNTLDMPTRQSFVIELVGKADLMNAIALNSSVFNLARILGPALAGIVMASAGVAVCFYANSISFAAVIIGLCFIRPLTVQQKPKLGTNIWGDIKEGLLYIYRSETLFKTIISTAIVGTFAMNFNVLVPVLAKVALKQQETGFGFLMSFMGIGSFMGAMTIATLSKSGPQKFVLQVVPFFVALFLILTGLANVYWVAGLGLAATGLCFVSFSSTANSTMQLNTADEYRGRVMSIYTLVFSGSTPIGNLYAGVITDRLGPRAGFLACGMIIIFLCLLVFIWRKTHNSEQDVISVENSL